MRRYSFSVLVILFFFYAVLVVSYLLRPLFHRFLFSALSYPTVQNIGGVGATLNARFMFAKTAATRLQRGDDLSAVELLFVNKESKDMSDDSLRRLFPVPLDVKASRYRVSARTVPVYQQFTQIGDFVSPTYVAEFAILNRASSHGNKRAESLFLVYLTHASRDLDFRKDFLRLRRTAQFIRHKEASVVFAVEFSRGILSFPLHTVKEIGRVGLFDIAPHSLLQQLFFTDLLVFGRNEKKVSFGHTRE